MSYEMMSSIQSQTLSENGEIQPQYIINASLAISLNFITDIFLKLAKEKNYLVVENDKGQVLIIKRAVNNIKDTLLACLIPSQLDRNLSAIRLSIVTNKIQCNRKVSVRGLRGSIKENTTFLNDFESQLKQQKKCQFESEDGDSQIDKTFIPTKSEEDEEEENEQNSNPFTLESTANYMFQKILCANAYGVGKRVSEFVSDFQQNYRNIEESAMLLPKPIEGIVGIVNEIVDSLFSDFNYGKGETKAVMPYCKISVEKYIFGKLFENIYAMYTTKNHKVDSQFLAQSEKIREKYSTVDIFKFLESKQRYWLVKNEEDFEKDVKQNPSIRPYNDAIKEFEKIKFCNSPREKLKCTMMMRSMMRAAVIDFHKGSQELASMDDELPIVIYIILMADVPNFFSELSIVDDFISMDPTIETEQRFLMNIRVSGEYISKEWNI